MRALALQHYLETPRKLVRARLISASKKADAEIVELEVDVDLPQRPLHRISKTERLRVRFPAADAMPQVFALRKNFPLVPHTMINEVPYPRQLCLYERSWADERENWAPRPFVERIRRWLAGTADGTLHRADQPLEPIMQHSPARIVLPAVPFAAGKLCRVERFFIVQCAHFFWAAQREKPAWAPDAVAVPALIIQGPPVQHGVIHELPLTLGDLEKLLVSLGGSLVAAISAQIGAIREELKGFTKRHLLLVVELPKLREKGGQVESVEHRAFFVGSEIGELFKTEVEQVKENGLWVPKKRELFENPARLKGTQLMPLSVRWHLSANLAAAINGYVLSGLKILAVGAGSLGSQVTNNLWRGGFGEWTLVDNDDLEPHNPARHLLNADALGRKKAHALSATMQAVFPDRSAPAWIACDYLAPGEDDLRLSAALKGADLVLDFSASVTVERRLASDQRGSARRMSAFLNQRGDESVLLVEDAERKVDLFWLEAEYLQAVAFDPKLIGHFDDAGTVAHRYGNGCRDVSATVPQEGVALHSGVLSHRIRKAAATSEAAIVVSRWSRETGAVVVVNVVVSVPTVVEIAGWKVMLHPTVVQQLVEQRAKNLPNETGGILVGVVDRTQHTLSVVGMMAAPPDSDAWPTSFIRGSNGLATSVSRTMKRTLGNVVYVGEWHSHPDGYDATPSIPDAAAVAICSPNTRADGLPTLMIIVASGEIGVVLQPLERDEVHLAKMSI